MPCATEVVLVESECQPPEIVDCIFKLIRSTKTKESKMKASANNIELQIRNAVIKLNRGKMEIVRIRIFLVGKSHFNLDQFLREAPEMRDASWRSGIFCKWEEFEAFLKEHGFPHEYFEDVQDIWENAVVY
jgi:hypothetical protein